MGLSSASYAMVAMVVSLSVDLIAAQDDGATSPPSELILPSNATSTMAVISTASFDDPCSEDTRTCMALLQADCNLDSPPEYMSCSCTSRQKGALECMKGDAAECGDAINQLTNLYCAAAQYYSENSYVPMQTPSEGDGDEGKKDEETSEEPSPSKTSEDSATKTNSNSKTSASKADDEGSSDGEGNADSDGSAEESDDYSLNPVFATGDSDDSNDSGGGITGVAETREVASLAVLIGLVGFGFVILRG